MGLIIWWVVETKQGLQGGSYILLLEAIYPITKEQETLVVVDDPVEEGLLSQLQSNNRCSQTRWKDELEKFTEPYIFRVACCTRLHYILKYTTLQGLLHNLYTAHSCKSVILQTRTCIKENDTYNVRFDKMELHWTETEEAASYCCGASTHSPASVLYEL